MSHAFYADAENLSKRRNQNWYYNKLMPILLEAKEHHSRDIDTSIGLAQQLIKLLDEPRIYPKPVEPKEVVPVVDLSEMMPVEPEIADIFYKSTEKGGASRYLKERYKKWPEHKYYTRSTTYWDYGWRQKESRVPARDVNRGKCAILRDTFYRKNNVGPDPPHYAQPSGATVSICSQYQCKGN